MVLEQLFKASWLEHRPYYSFILGFLYTLIGYGTSIIFFGKHVSIAMLFLATLLIAPSLRRLITMEEAKDRRIGVKRFFYNHKEIFEVFIFLFLGIFTAYMILGATTGSFVTVFNYQVTFLEERGSIGAEVIEGLGTYNVASAPQHFTSLLTSNMLTVIIFFLLSIFYGIGSVFLGMLNASVFASFVVYLWRQADIKLAPLVAAFSLHMIPEVVGFLIAAIAGAIVGKAIIVERFGTKEFRNITKEAVFMLILSFVIITIAAAIEAFATGPFITQLI